jgi:hypothetical protein
MNRHAPQTYTKHPLARLEPHWLKLGVYYGAATILGTAGFAVVLVLRGRQQLLRQKRQHGLFNP